MSMMKKQSHSSGFIRCLAGCLAGWLLVGFSWQEPQSLDEQELLLRLTQQFAEARALFEDPQRQSQSIEFFSQIKNAIDDQRRSRGEIPREFIELEVQVLEYRARAFFNAGQLQGASDDFRQLVFANPRQTLDAEALSPKIVDFFEDIKNSLIGKIAVSSEPAGARVTVGGEFVGITNFFPVEVHTGTQRVEIILEGYEPIVYEEVRVLPGEVTTLDVTLVRNSAKLPIITDPPGVELWVDGEYIDKTGGTLPPDLRSFMPTGFDAEKLSAPLELHALPLGQHQIELKKDCYVPIGYSFNAEEPKDYTALIYKLEDSVAQLQVTSHPPGARVFVDGEYKGNTPLDLDRVCSGSHHLEVKHTTGKYVEDLTIERNEVFSLECPIRPSLAFLGLVAGKGVPAGDLDEMRENLVSELQNNLKIMNLIIPETDRLSGLLGNESLNELLSRELVPDQLEREPKKVRDLSEKLGKALEVEALLVGYVPEQRLIKDVVFNLVAVGSTAPDTYRLNTLDRHAVREFADRLSQPTPLYGSWIGLTSIDTLLADGPIVLRVEPEGPAALGGAQVADIVLEADGTPVKYTRELMEKVISKSPGESLLLKLSDGKSTREVRIEVGRTPIEIPLNRPDFLYNKAMIDLKHQMVMEPTDEPLARLNLALCHMELGNYDTALKEHLPRISLGEKSRGISQGTVYYYQGLSYMRLEEFAEAARMFQQALAEQEATLESNDGPRVASLAKRRLRELGQ